MGETTDHDHQKYPSFARRYPVGAELTANGVSFRVWAPACPSLELVLSDGREWSMIREPTGYFRLDVDDVAAGAGYMFRLTGASTLSADPASRFQPEGVDGWSSIVDPFHYRWRDGDWPGLAPAGQIVYELHVGTFTPEGTYAAAATKLHQLSDIGITCIELMPLNEFRGDFGWGYDGILPYAPSRTYGGPDDLRAFVDAAHAATIGLILDVVYNHFGADNRYDTFSPSYFTERYSNEWGRSINFDGPDSAAVREFVAANARYWIDEYHFDGLRLDATQALHDEGGDHIMAYIGREARKGAAGRPIYLVAENEPQESRLVNAPSLGGYGLDAVWNDDFHHSAMVAATGRREAYFHDHHGAAQEFVSSAKYGYLFQGQRYDWQNAARGTPAAGQGGPTRFIHFLQNHDQIANSGTGRRLHQLCSPARFRALTALLLLGPQTPLLFQGQEFGASSPFYYFADGEGPLARQVRQGRLDFLSQFPSLANAEFSSLMAEPSSRTTFDACKLDWTERTRNKEIVRLHRDLIGLRSQCRALATGTFRHIDGGVLGDGAFLLRYVAEDADDERILVVNLGKDLAVDSRPDPLLAPPADRQWCLRWSSEDFRYGGSGIRPVDFRVRTTITAESALLFSPVRAERPSIPDHDALTDWQRSISA